MFKTSDDIARAALDLLQLSVTLDPEKEAQRIASLELAAGVLANHVWDWHVREERLSGKEDRPAFVAKYPMFSALNAVANGTKHPFPVYPDIGKAGAPKFIEWEHPDLWYSPVTRPTLMIEVDGQERSIHSLTHFFCDQYLKRAG